MKNIKMTSLTKISNYSKNLSLLLAVLLVAQILLTVASIAYVYNSSSLIANATTLKRVNSSSRTLRNGETSGEVMTLQHNLTWLGFFNGNINGYYGNDTTQAVKAFQRFIGLEQTGFANRATLTKLGLWKGQPIAGSLAVVGDSMSQENRSLIARNIIRKGYRITDMFTIGGTQMVGNSPYNMFDGKTVIDIYNKNLTDNPDTWLIVLGSNDVIWDTGTGTWSDVPTQLSRTVASISERSDKVHWVNVYVKDMPTNSMNEESNSVRLNALLLKEARARGNMYIVDWYAVGSKNPAYLRDYVHLKDDKRKIYADIVTSTL